MTNEQREQLERDLVRLHDFDEGTLIEAFNTVNFRPLLVEAIDIIRRTKVFAKVKT